MADTTDDIADAVPPTTPARRRVLRRTLAGLGLALLAALALAWFQREEIADSLIRDQLDQLGLDATYDIETIGPRRQVLVNVVVGDPDRPDLTIERVETSLVPRWPFATIGRIRLVKPRLYGTYVDGKLSFGALDPLLFEQPPQEKFEIPDIDLMVEDARALIEGDHGAIGIKLAGEGNLRNGFSGILAATAPRLVYGGCSANDASLYGKIAVKDQRPAFDGPLRLASLACPGWGLSASRVVSAIDARIDAGFGGVAGTAGLGSGHLAYGVASAASLDGTLRFSWRDNGLTSSYELSLERPETPQFSLASLALEGSARTREGFSRIEIESAVDGAGLRPGPQIDATLAGASKAAALTLAAPIVERIRTELAREGRGSTIAADLVLRSGGGATSLVVPGARWKGTSGETLLDLTRFQLSLDGSAPPRFAGNFMTAGQGLPRIAGRMESRAAGGTQFTLRMAEYRAGGASIALPELTVTQSGGGYGFSGQVLASGPVPGGSVTRLALPIEGNWSASGALSLWRECATIEFDRLELGNAALAKRGLRLCPTGTGPIFAQTAAGTRLAGIVPDIDLAGTISSSPFALRAASLSLAWPGVTALDEVDLRLGAGEQASRFTVGTVTLDLARGLGGRFERSDTYLAAVPLDVLGASGNWRFTGGGVRLDGASFTLRDRTSPGRFDPLSARDAWLSFAGSGITAGADLREPRSDRVIARADIAHDLQTGIGRAELTVDRLVFDERLQPDGITMLAQGVVANVFGVVDGKGRIDWSPASLTSSGVFTTRDLDFAAAFGPVHGVSGTIRFTDLLGMVTAPQQVLTIRSFNPGIQVDEGHLTYELRPGYEMVVHGGVWPFIGGTLILEPTTTMLTATETRRYTLRLIAVDAAQFVQRMEMANIAATGRFDGRVPLVFDEDGGRLEGGYLVSRPPGGNLSYVGALTYEDMNPIANFAFDALRSLDFTKMEVSLDGPLAGEIVTKVRFDGIKQGDDARRNLITRQIARLPIRFNVNIRAPFYKLLTSIKTMYDPAFIADPRAVGLLDDRGQPVDEPELAPLSALRPKDLPEAEAGIQTPDSEDAP